MNYSFFDYKYFIEGYHGEHYGSTYQTVYLIATIAFSLLLSVLLRKTKKETVKSTVGIIGIVVTVLYIAKTLWESHYDVATGRGFNTYLLPFDTCSIVMWAAIIGGFGKGWFADWARKWLCTLGFVGGFSTAMYLYAFKYYPFFTFGAFYSMLWHAAMVFIAWWLLISGTVHMEWSDILRAFGFHAVFSVLPIAINLCVSHMNWMFYDNADDLPLVNVLSAPYTNTWKAAVIMLLAYLAITAAFVALYRLIYLLGRIVKKPKHTPVLA